MIYLTKTNFSGSTALATARIAPKICQGQHLHAYVGRTQVSRVNILAPWAKGSQNGGERVHVFNGYSELAFLCNGTDGQEILAKTSIGVLSSIARIAAKSRAIIADETTA